MDIYKSAGIIIKDKKFLMVRAEGRDRFLSPGGKIEAGETSKQALIRELLEEVSLTVDEDGLEEFGHFEAIADDTSGRVIKMEVFIVKNWLGEILAASEIEELCWVDSANQHERKLGSIFEHQVLPLLAERGLID